MGRTRIPDPLRAHRHDGRAGGRVRLGHRDRHQRGRDGRRGDRGADRPHGCLRRRDRDRVARVRRPDRGEPERGPGARPVRQLQGKPAPTGLLVGEPVYGPPQDLRSCAQLRERQAQGERPRRQPDRDRRCRGVAGDRYGGSSLRGGRLRELRPGAVRVGPAEPGDIVPIRRSRGGPALAACERARGVGAAEGRDPGPAARRPVSR